MVFNKRFYKTLGFTSLAMMVFMVALVFVRIYFLKNDYPEGRSLMLELFYQIPTGILWWAIAYYTRDYKAAIIVFSLLLLDSIFLFSQYLLPFEKDIPIGINWGSVLYMIFCYALFGLLHFKSYKGLFMGLLFLLSYSTSVFAMYQNNPLMDNLLEILKMEDFFQIHIQLSETSYRYFNVLDVVLQSLKIIINFFLFIGIYHLIKSGIKSFISYRFDPAKMNFWSFFILFWSLRIVLYAIVVNIIFSIYQFSEYFKNEKIIFSVLFLYPALLLLAIIYQKVLVQFFLDRGRYPNFLYLIVNIPFLNLIIWPFLFTMKPANKNHEDKTPDIVWKKKIDDLKIRFVENNRNFYIIALLFILNVLVFIDQMIRYDSGAVWYESKTALIIIGAINLIIFVVYAANHRVYYSTLIYFALMGILAVSLGYYSLLLVFSVATFINFAIYYPLFHFDRIEFNAKPEEEKKEEIYSW